MALCRRSSKDTGMETFLSSLNKTSNMDLNRNSLRKHSTRDHEPVEFSQQSILSTMDRFVQAVNNMDDTIMVPSRLLDMPLQKESSGNANVVPRAVMSTDLYSFYTMLNAVKTELIWGAANGKHESKKKPVNARKMSQPARCDSLTSMNSCSDSDMESESSTESDSGVEIDEHSLRIAASFRQHMLGLFNSLHQLTESANYLTSRYQEEVGGGNC